MAETKKAPLLETRELKKYFKVKKSFLHAVDNINLTIDEGKTLGVVGESGCGKSTLGRTVLRLLERSADPAALLERVWGYDSDAVENHVEVYVCFLRKKLASIGSNIRIESIRRLGYHLEVSGDD